MKKQLKKLKLNKMTVQVLTKGEQNKVVGGGTDMGCFTDPCPEVSVNTCGTFCCPTPEPPNPNPYPFSVLCHHTQQLEYCS